MRFLGGTGIGKKNASKNVEKLAKIGRNFDKFVKIQLFSQKFRKNSHFFQINILLVWER